MSFVVESDTRTRRRRKTLITLGVLLLFLFFALYYAKSYLDNRPSSSPAPTKTCSLTATPPVKLNGFPVNVYNATKRQGLAASTAKLIGARGYKIGQVANDPLRRTITASAEIRYGKAGADNAKLAQPLLDKPTLIQDARADASVDIVLGDGFSGLTAAPTTTSGC